MFMIEFTEKEMDESQEKELADDLIAIIQHFAARTIRSALSKDHLQDALGRYDQTSKRPDRRGQFRVSGRGDTFRRRIQN